MRHAHDVRPRTHVARTLRGPCDRRRRRARERGMHRAAQRRRTTHMAISRTARSGRAHAARAGALVLAATAGLCACGDNGGAAPDLAPPPPDLALADLKAPGYPGGPTGPNVGDVVPDFTFQ